MVRPGSGPGLHSRSRTATGESAKTSAQRTLPPSRIAPETMSRLMRNLSDRGVIEVEGYTVRVLDLKALRRIGGA